MRLVELAIEAFQALERAHVEFGPGLNVLYGPNDLGKSTLAAAIRAALLVPPKTKGAESFESWYADAVPQVTLTFADDQDHFWRIKKTFGIRASAELLHSKDGKQFSLDCKAREVDEKVRDLLQWGIAAPGGKVVSRGLPTSFLAKALLAAQTDVDGILAASLEADHADSGKLKLRKALATLAQDPLFKRVLDAAKQEYDEYFTSTGGLSRRRGAKLVEANKAVKTHEAELARLRLELDQSRGIADEVRRFSEACTNAEHAFVEAEAALASARLGLANAQRRGVLAAQLTAAQAGLAEIDVQAARVQALEREQQQLGAQLEACRRALEQAIAESEQLALAQREAEHALQRASGDAAEQKRKLREAELEREAAQLREKRLQLESRRDELQRATQALEARDAAAKELTTNKQQLSVCTDQLTQARSALAAADQECDLARRVLLYGRWRAAQDGARHTEQLRQEHATLTRKAATLEAESNALREQHERRATEIAERRAKLPSPERLKQLDSLRQALERAEAALGGGLSIRVSPRRPGLTLHATLDRAPAHDTESLTTEHAFEAERSALLRIDDLVEIEISAGAAEKRREVAELRQRYETEVTPVLDKAAVASLASLESALEALRQESLAADALRQQAEARAAEVRSTRERGASMAKQLDAQPVHDVAARRAAIGSMSLELLEPRWRKLGTAWEAHAETERERAEQLQTTARTRVNELEQQHKIVDYQQREAEKLLSERTEQAAAFASMLGGKAASEVLKGVAGELTLLSARQREVEASRDALTAQAGDERAKAEQALTRSKAACEHAQGTQKERQSALERTKSQLDTAIGSARVEAARLASMDRAAAEQRLQLCAAQLAACPEGPVANTSDVEAAETSLERARRALGEHREELHKAEGALTRVGGAQLQDRLQQELEAFETACAREHALRVDAEAWKLLRDALTQAETEESEHLGVALARPVGEKLHELTRGRYREISFNQHMTAAQLKADGATPDAKVLDGLSVGTRNQLATLVRLTIASQLKSAIILDDHLVHTDPARLGWFREVLRKTALDTQVLILTCRPEDYLERDEFPTQEPIQDIAGGTVRAIDLTGLLQRWTARK